MQMTHKFAFNVWYFKLEFGPVIVVCGECKRRVQGFQGNMQKESCSYRKWIVLNYIMLNLGRVLEREEGGMKYSFVTNQKLEQNGGAGEGWEY